MDVVQTVVVKFKDTYVGFTLYKEEVSDIKYVAPHYGGPHYVDIFFENAPTRRYFDIALVEFMGKIR